MALAAPSEPPAISIQSDAYQEIGEDNLFSFLIGVTSPGTYTISDGLGERQVTFEPVGFDSESGGLAGTRIPFKAPDNGEIKIWGDASKIDVIVADGAYIKTIDMPECTGLEILNLEHNALQRLDLSGFSNLMAIYLTDNPFTAETPLKIGPDKPLLQILELDIIDHIDQSFNLSDYPELVIFDGYHNMDLRNVDPTGCPKLRVLSLEMAPVETLDVTRNPILERLNISETRITSIDLSHNPRLEHLLAGHDSGTINTEYRLGSIDLSNNPLIKILNLNGNHLGAVDLSHNKAITNLYLSRNSLTSLDLSANTNLYSVTIWQNDMDFATLPLPEPTWGEYFYKQNSMPVARSVKAGATIDLSNRVLRAGTQTIARVWKCSYTEEPLLIDESLYSYNNGKITFPQAMPDSVYVEFANSALTEYTMTTTPFMVKSDGDFGKPSKIVSFVPSSSGEIAFAVGMYGASTASPKTFMVDFGNGHLVECQAFSALDAVTANVFGTPTGMVTIYIPEGEVMTALNISGVPLASIDLSAATELGKLTLSDCGLYEIDLRHNRCLTDLDLSGNQLTTLDLTGSYGNYEKNVLENINVERNNLSSFTNVATRATKSLDLSDNKLEEITLKNYDNLVSLDLSNNLLSAVDIEYISNATNVDLHGNSLVEINNAQKVSGASLNVSDNNLCYKTLPVPETMGTGYVYAPQKPLVIPAKAPVVSLSAYGTSAGSQPNVYVWKKTDGTVLTAGVDYEADNGVFSFLKEDLGTVYCEISNAAFPQMAGENVLRTTETQVIARPTYVAASFTTLSENDNPEVIFASTEPTQLYIDWNGDGSELTAYDIEQQYKIFPVENIRRNANVKVYATDAEEVAKVNVFSIYDIRLKDVDLTPLKPYAISLGNTMLTPEDIKMPTVPGLGELNLSGNRFSTYPYSQNFPNLSLLNLSANNFTEFDASTVGDISSLIISDNKISQLSFNNPMMWSLDASGNYLTSVNLEGLPAIEQILLHSNYLTTIDLEPVKSTLQAINLVGNYFTFSTLPLPSAYPQLRVFYYGNQMPMEAELTEDMQVDLASQSMIDGNSTEYKWYRGIPEYNPETEMFEGDALKEGREYTIENGITTFLCDQAEKVMCIMTNATFPNLFLYTNQLTITGAGVDGIEADADDYVTVYNIQGMLVGKGQRKEVTDNLESGIYIINGKKTIIK